jgi:hypothetical protein
VSAAAQATTAEVADALEAIVRPVLPRARPSAPVAAAPGMPHMHTRQLPFFPMLTHPCCVCAGAGVLGWICSACPAGRGDHRPQTSRHHGLRTGALDPVLLSSRLT